MFEDDRPSMIMLAVNSGIPLVFLVAVVTLNRAKYSPRLAQNDQRMEDEIPGRSPARPVRGSRAELLELASAIEAVQGRVPVSEINKQSMTAGGSAAEYAGAVDAAVAHGWLKLHPRGSYLSFTPLGACLFL